MKINKKNFLLIKRPLLAILFPFFLLFRDMDNFANAQEVNINNEFEINTSTKSDYNNNSEIPTNPFEIVEMIRRANSINDATNPSDAIDEALRSFDKIKENNINKF